MRGEEYRFMVTTYDCRGDVCVMVIYETEQEAIDKASQLLSGHDTDKIEIKVLKMVKAPTISLTSPKW